MDNYTGPYWSDGKVQSSVEFGTAIPTSLLDEQSRLHDSAYAKFKDQHQLLTAADYIYNENTKNLGVLGKVAGFAVLYGNHTQRSINGLFDGNIPGVTNSIRLQDWLENKEKYIKQVKDYYETDPLKTTHQSAYQLNISRNTDIYKRNGGGYQVAKGTNAKFNIQTPVVIDYEPFDYGEGIEYNPYKVIESTPSTLMTGSNISTRGARWAPRWRRTRQKYHQYYYVKTY